MTVRIDTQALDLKSALPSLEDKAAGHAPNDPAVGAAMGELSRAFEAFKETNDERLEAIEKRMSADVLVEEKLERIGKTLDRQKTRLDDMQVKAQRPGLGGGRETANAAADEHKQAFQAYVRRGEAAGLTETEQKAMSIGSSPDGGYLVPFDTETEITRLLSIASPIRAISGVRQISAAIYKKPFLTTGMSAGWAAETAARPQTNNAQLAELQFPAMELYAMPAATQALLDDSVVNLDQWIAEEVQTSFAEQEGTAFVSGNGVARPRGFLDYPKITDTTWSWGNLGYLPTGVAGGFAAANPSDKLVDIAYALKAGYRQNAQWVMNRKVQGAIRKFKDVNGEYLWQPAIRADGKATLMGFPVTEAEDMPDIAVDSFALAFGDFARGYLIVDRVGVRVLRDPYSSKPYVLFYTTKRVGGGVQNFEALKLLKFGLT